MLEVRVRGLAPEVVAAIRERAIENGNTMEDEIRQILTESITAPEPVGAGARGSYSSHHQHHVWAASRAVSRDLRARH